MITYLFALLYSGYTTKKMLKNLANKIKYIFLLYETSIGNGQQGISYNGSRLGEVGDLEAKSPNFSTNFK